MPASVDLHGVPVADNQFDAVALIASALIAKRRCNSDPAMCRWAVRLATLTVQQWLHEPNVARAHFEDSVVGI